jgi:peptidyl-prolyl cis-trans isomerase C
MSLQNATADSRPKQSLIRRWSREPLVHFLIAGAVLFAGYRVLNPEPDRREALNRVEVSDEDVAQMTVAWAAQWQRAPTASEMRGLVAAKAQEQVLYREALALGLDKGDAIVIRRLAQKMDFLAEDMSTVPDPQPTELRGWFEKNGARFALPALMSFRHLYFSFDQRAERTKADAERALVTLVAKSASAADDENLADQFMLQDYYGDRSPEQVASMFGGTFGEKLFEMKPGAWQGPIESGFGWHLIWIDSVTPGRVPAFETVEGMVKAEWTNEQRAAAKRKAIEMIRARYEVVLPKSPVQ